MNPGRRFLFFRERGKWCRRQSSLLIPSHSDQIVNAATEPVPHAVFGNACRSLSMIHGNLPRLYAGAVNQDRQETMPAVERKDPVERRPLEHTQGTAGVLKVRLEHAFARPAGDV